MYSDGASRGNPGMGGCGALLTNAKGDVIAKKKKFLGENVTNNVAEYHGLLLGLQLAKEYSATELQCHLDSELVVKQMQGIYRVKNKVLQSLYVQAKFACKDLTQVTFHAIPRAANAKADALANEAIEMQQN